MLGRPPSSGASSSSMASTTPLTNKPTSGQPTDTTATTSDSSPTTTGTPVSKKKKKKSMFRISVILAVLSWAFEIFTVAVNLTDVVSDGLVCWEFYENEEYNWLIALLVVLFIGNIVFVTFTVTADPTGLYKKHMGWQGKDAIIPFILMVPFAQFIPAASWVYTIFIQPYQLAKAATNGRKLGNGETKIGKRKGPRNNSYNNNTADDSTTTVAQSLNRSNTTGAGAEGLNDIEDTVDLVAKLQTTIKHHIESHAYFYAETAVESIPQMALQLLAAACLQRVTPIQSISMFCSLVSIVSKAFIVTASATIPMILWKFSVCAADILCTFYLVSTIYIQPNGGAADALLLDEGGGGVNYTAGASIGSVGVGDTNNTTTSSLSSASVVGVQSSTIASMWVAKIWYTVLFALVMMTICVVVHRRKIIRDTRNKRMNAVGVCLFALVVSGPAVLLAESARLIYTLFLTARLEVITAESTVLMNFLTCKDDRTASSSQDDVSTSSPGAVANNSPGLLQKAKSYFAPNAELRRRVKFITVLFVEGFKGVPDGRRWLNEKGRRYTHTNYDTLPPNIVDKSNDSYAVCSLRRLIAEAVEVDAEVATPQGSHKFPLPAINWPIKFDANTTTRRIMNLPAEAYTARIRSFFRTLRNFTPEQTTVVCGCATVAVYAAGQVFTLTLPFINYYQYFYSHNALQHACFGAFAAFLMVVIGLLPHAVWYTLFMWRYIWLFSHFSSVASQYTYNTRSYHFEASGNNIPPSKVTAASCLFAAVEMYFMPPPGVLLRQSVEPEVLPAELCDVVGGFMVSGRDIKLKDMQVKDAARLRAFEESIQ